MQISDSRRALPRGEAVAGGAQRGDAQGVVLSGESGAETWVLGGYILTIYLTGGHLHFILVLTPLTHHQLLVACGALLCDRQLVGDGGGGGGNVEVPGGHGDDGLNLALSWWIRVYRRNYNIYFSLFQIILMLLRERSKEVCRGRFRSLSDDVARMPSRRTGMLESWTGK